MKDDDLYVRYQTLGALISVLLHDLRNPLHSATLLVEAMGARTADVESLRGKLRGQFGKLDGLIGEASDAIKELALEKRVENVAVDDLLRSAAESVPALAASDIELTVPASTALRVSVDTKVLLRAMAEIGATIFERAIGSDKAGRPGEKTVIALGVEPIDAKTVRLFVGGWMRPLDDAAVKQPFTITGGGIRLALARNLAGMAGAMLRLEQSPEGAIRYALDLAPA
jgi:hypothetical protein